MLNLLKHFVASFFFFTCAVNTPSNKAVQDISGLVAIFTDRGTTMSCTEGISVRGTRLSELIGAAGSCVTLSASVTLHWTNICWNKQAVIRIEASIE